MAIVKREASVDLSPEMQEKERAVEKRLYISVPARCGEQLKPKRERSGGRILRDRSAACTHKAYRQEEGTVQGTSLGQANTHQKLLQTAQEVWR